MANYQDNGSLDSESSIANRGSFSWVYKNFIPKHWFNKPGGVPQLNDAGVVNQEQLPASTLAYTGTPNRILNGQTETCNVNCQWIVYGDFTVEAGGTFNQIGELVQIYP